MDELWTRIVENLAGRLTGPMKFRFLLQPTVAAILAIRSGLKDAREGNPAYFWGLLRADPDQRVRMLKDGWKSVGKVFLVALAIDVAYQLLVLRWVYPGELLVIALALAILPYLILRGLTTRIARRGASATAEAGTAPPADGPPTR